MTASSSGRCSAARPGGRPHLDLDTVRWFEIADSGASYDDKIAAYRTLADAYFQQEQYDEFVATSLGDFDRIAVDYFDSRISTGFWSRPCNRRFQRTSTTSSWRITAD